MTFKEILKKRNLRMFELVEKHPSHWPPFVPPTKPEVQTTGAGESTDPALTSWVCRGVSYHSSSVPARNWRLYCCRATLMTTKNTITTAEMRSDSTSTTDDIIIQSSTVQSLQLVWQNFSPTLKNPTENLKLTQNIQLLDKRDISLLFLSLY